MILRTLAVECWRCFVDAVTLGPFSEGLNVIHGPNGAGKSTLVMALVRCLFDNHNVGGEAVQSLRPWGRDVSPKVSVEFEHEGATYRLTKQFLDLPKAELSRKEGDRFVLLAEGRKADEQARRILAGEASGRGMTQRRHWGLAQILWVPQGQLPIESLSSGTEAAIRESLGAHMAGPGEDALEKKINAEYSQFFTPGGKLKSGRSAPEIARLRKELDEKRNRLPELRH
ncbi:MAG TPA: hypothetical protein EYP14_14985, partial [Planctomycetaceae bacterium]|nr:hypothetical protein [Planctomycetaceae bacterium]